MSSCAPEAAGTVSPSEWGAVLRTFEGRDSRATAAYVDPDVAPVVDQGIRLLMPLLEAAGRRAWSGPAPVRPSDRPAPDKWARIEIADQGKLPSFSRGDLERTARSAFATAIACSKSPPLPYLPSGANVIANSNANGAWTQRVGDEPVSSPLALVPLVDEVKTYNWDEANAVLGAPPPQRAGNRGAGQAIWCVAARDLGKGERVAAVDPWL